MKLDKLIDRFKYLRIKTWSLDTRADFAAWKGKLCAFFCRNRPFPIRASRTPQRETLPASLPAKTRRSLFIASSLQRLLTVGSIVRGWRKSDVENWKHENARPRLIEKKIKLN